MCTLTFIPNPKKSDGFFVTSNRDESVNRPAKEPQIYKEHDAQLFYPKDERAGGTWIGASNKKRLICLMNGAFSRHERKTPYRKSRGTVVKELLASADILVAIENYKFDGIEPFFIVLVSWKAGIEVFELIWDGTKVHLNNKDETQPAIWSAAMTYDEKQREERQEKFRLFLRKHGDKELRPQLLWDFHRGNGGEEGLLIQRGELQTTSISQFRHTSDGEIAFRFEDLISGKTQDSGIIWKPNDD